MGRFSIPVLRPYLLSCELVLCHQASSSTVPFFKLTYQQVQTKFPDVNLIRPLKQVYSAADWCGLLTENYPACNRTKYQGPSTIPILRITVLLESIDSRGQLGKFEIARKQVRSLDIEY